MSIYIVQTRFRSYRSRSRSTVDPIPLVIFSKRAVSPANIIDRADHVYQALNARAGPWFSMYCPYYCKYCCTGWGGCPGASTLTIYVRPTTTPHKTGKPIKIHGVRAERAHRTAILIERGGREGDREHDGKSRLNHWWLGLCGSWRCPWSRALGGLEPRYRCCCCCCCCWCGGCVGS